MNSNFPLSEANLPITVQQLRAEVTFEKARDVLAEKGIGVLLLKGPHLGSTVYDSPLERVYGDLDLLVRPGDFATAAAALQAAGFKPFAFDTYAPEIQRDFKHWEFTSLQGIVVELHRWLSGHDRYNVDGEGLFARAEPFVFGRTQALGLGAEDLLLHLCLHMGTSYFYVIERKHVLDIAMLAGRRSLDWPVFLRRAKKAGAAVIAYYALTAARLQGSALIPAEVLRALRPGKLRRLWLEASLDPASFPIYRHPGRPMKSIKRNLLLPLLDRPGQWLGFFWRLAATQARKARRVIRQG